MIIFASDIQWVFGTLPVIATGKTEGMYKTYFSPPGLTLQSLKQLFIKYFYIKKNNFIYLLCTRNI